MYMWECARYYNSKVIYYWGIGGFGMCRVLVNFEECYSTKMVFRTCTQMYEESKYIMSCTIVVTSSSCVMMMVHQSIWKISEVCDKEKGISYLSASIVFYHASNVSFDGGISKIGKNILSNI